MRNKETTVTTQEGKHCVKINKEETGENLAERFRESLCWNKWKKIETLTLTITLETWASLPLQGGNVTPYQLVWCESFSTKGKFHTLIDPSVLSRPLIDQARSCWHNHKLSQFSLHTLSHARCKWSHLRLDIVHFALHSTRKAITVVSISLFLCVLEESKRWKKRTLFPFNKPLNGPFPSSPQSLFQSESKCEIVVMVISSNFNMNESWFS